MSTGFYLLDYINTVPQYSIPRRGGQRFSGTIIVHTAECAMDFEGGDDSAENCANFIRTRSDYGSYHQLVDSDSRIAMAPWYAETWQDLVTNGWAVGISAAVQANHWLSLSPARRDAVYRNLAAAGADAVRYAATQGITVPIRRISGNEARRGVTGFCAHGDSGVDRYDPGPLFDWNLFLRYVAENLGGKVTISPSAPVSTIRKVTAQGALVRTAPNTNARAIPHYPEGFAVGAPLAVLGYVKGQDPFGTGDDAWFKTEGNGYIWANNAGNSLDGLAYLGDMSPKAPGPSPTPPVTPSKPSSGLKNTDKQWVFAKGETMAQAAKYFGTSVAELAKFNGIKDPNKVAIGTNVWPPIPGAGLWIVEKGETLTQVAKYYGRTVEDVKRANGLTSTNIKVGQRLIVL